MSSNPYQQFAGLINPQAALVNSAKYGETGNRFLDAIAPVMSLLGGAHQAYQSGSRSGNLIPGIQGAMQQMATRNYLNQVRRDQLAAQAYQQQQAAKKAQDNQYWAFRTTGQNDGYLGTGDLPGAETLNIVRQNNQNPNINSYLAGGPLRMNPYGSMSADIIKDNMSRVAAVTDANATIDQLPQYAGQGYNRTMAGYGNPTGQQWVNPSPAPTPGQPQLMSLDDAPVLQAGAQQTQVPPASPLFQTNPYGVAAPNADQLLEAQSQGITARKDKETNDRGVEANRIDDAELQAKINAGYFSHPAPAGPAPNEWSFLGGLIDQGIVDPSQVYQDKYGQGQEDFSKEAKSIEDRMMRDGFIDPKTKQIVAPSAPSDGGLFGLGKSTQADRDRYERFQKYNTARNKAIQSMLGNQGATAGAAGASMRGNNQRVIKGASGNVYSIP